MASVLFFLFLLTSFAASIVCFVFGLFGMGFGGITSATIIFMAFPIIVVIAGILRLRVRARATLLLKEGSLGAGNRAEEFLLNILLLTPVIVVLQIFICKFTKSLHNGFEYVSVRQPYGDLL